MKTAWRTIDLLLKICYNENVSGKDGQARLDEARKKSNRNG
jgi:hypothetical protein